MFSGELTGMFEETNYYLNNYDFVKTNPGWWKFFLGN